MIRTTTIIGALLALAIAGWYIRAQNKDVQQQVEQQKEAVQNQSTEDRQTEEQPSTAKPDTANVPDQPHVESKPAKEVEPLLIKPIDQFDARITKKSFGTYSTPQNSPVSPERFTGFHTGVDVEYGDKPGEDIPVRAIADGEVVLSRTADGYGGVMVIRHTVEGKPLLALYGHLDPATMKKLGTAIEQGDQLGILGDGNTSETDGERKHLHFSVQKGTTVTIRGYVSSEDQLSGWQDPKALFEQF